MTRGSFRELLRRLRTAISTRESCAVEYVYRGDDPMRKVVVAIKDKVVELFNEPMVFENADIAYVSIRRVTRDAFADKKITLDQLNDQQLVCIGQFDTKTGAMLSFDEEDYEVMEMADFVKDMDDDEISD